MLYTGLSHDVISAMLVSQTSPLWVKTLSLCIDDKVFLVVICTVYFVSFVTCDLCLEIRSIHDIEDRVLRLPVFTIYTDKPVGPRFRQMVRKIQSRLPQFHLPENDRKRLKLLSKMSFKKWNTNFHLEYSVRKNRTTFFRCPVAPRKCSAGTTKKVMFHYFPTGLSANLLKW